MTRDSIPAKNRRLFRITRVLTALIFGGIALWMFIQGHDTILAALIAGAAFFALIDAIAGWRKSKD